MCYLAVNLLLKASRTPFLVIPLARDLLHQPVLPPIHFLPTTTTFTILDKCQCTVATAKFLPVFLPHFGQDNFFDCGWCLKLYHRETKRKSVVEPSFIGILDTPIHNQPTFMAVANEDGFGCGMESQ